MSVNTRFRSRIGGFTTLTAADDVVVMDMVTTYSNQDPAGDEYYDKYYSEFPRKGVVATEAANEFGALNMRMGASTLAKSEGFPSGVSQSFDYDGTLGNEPKATGDDALLGTFNGVPGKFSCSGTDNICSAGTNTSGGLTLGASWVFTPDGDPENIVVKSVIADADYLVFSYWVETTIDMINDETTYTVGVTHMGVGPAPNIGAMVAGNATYMGPAAGIFARRAYDPESGGDVETAGRFTADATLTADFDDGDLVVDGTIDNFMHAGSAIDSEWMVTMTEGMITRDGAAFVSNPLKQTDDSVWSGQFNGHYDGDVNDPSTPADERKLQPTGATGTFSNAFDNGRVLGAFGVEKE